MEFWGVEVKAGETVKCEPGEDRLLHLSQAALGETKSKGAERVPIYVKFNDQKLVLGTLSAENCAQISYDLVFEKEFELSHGSKNASVYLTGYKTDLPEVDEFPGDFDESDSEEDVPVAQNAKGALKVKSQEEKPAKAKSNVDKVDNAAAKSKAKAGKLVKDEPKTGDGDDEDDSDSEDDDYSEESDDDDDDVDMTKAMGDGDDDEDSDEDGDEDDDDEDDESSEEEDEETPPKKPANGKKRAAKATPKASAPEKKAKLTTPASGQKTGGDGKKGTPGKASANSDKSKQQTPKSAGSVSCKSCSKSFNSESALEAHSKAKHSGAK